ncbi:coproporphyrinogen III oxidase-like Fe-S oxidoreductase [Bradyrhizobium yuanmingense]|uniref:Coproporphyrinogen III oxidase-like Fe-S oxidoreductase n=1 Tax=Bradyrhizobium yuanmingense TaxID=108015 RepID=A0ABV4GJX8_9BRAD
MHAPTATPLVRSAPPRSRITNPGALLALHPELRIDQDIYNINVTANFGATLTASETWQQIATHDGAQKPVHLYFHLPLCSYVCRFCNYVKRQAPTGAKLDDALDHWTGLLIEESQRYLRGAPWLSAARVESLFLGGGTASLLRPRHLARIMRHVQDNYSVIPGCEATLEGNPDNFLADEVSDAIEIGFNRFSVGLQSLDSKVNAFAGRGHDRQMSLKSVCTTRICSRRLRAGPANSDSSLSGFSA